jgi:hypothetical protein
VSSNGSGGCSTGGVLGVPATDAKWFLIGSSVGGSLVRVDVLVFLFFHFCVAASILTASVVAAD